MTQLPFRRQNSASSFELSLHTPGTEYDVHSGDSSQANSPDPYTPSFHGGSVSSEDTLTVESRRDQEELQLQASIDFHQIGNPKKTTTKKIQYTRSKTGCQTCRERKKKCGEEKPVCKHCKRTNRECVYTPKIPYSRSLESKIDPGPGEGRPLTLHEVHDHVGTLDLRLFHYFKDTVSHRLAPVDGPVSFSGLIIQLAEKNPGVMHSLLYLGASCLTAASIHPDANVISRQLYHRDAMKQHLKPAKVARHESVDSTVASTILFYLQALWQSTPDGSCAFILTMLRKLLASASTDNVTGSFGRCVMEFAVYLDFANRLAHAPSPAERQHLPSVHDVLRHTSPTGDTVLIGPLSGLFAILYEIWAVRDHARLLRQQDPENWEAIVQAQDPRTMAISERLKHLKNWNQGSGQGSARDYASQLYYDCANIYLQRSIRRSHPHPRFTYAVSHGLNVLHDVEIAQHDTCMDSVLLMPLFLLGCAAFDLDHRTAIAEAFNRLELRDRLRRANIANVRNMVVSIWHAMDAGTEEQSWDWEALFDQSGYFMFIA